MTVEAIVKTHLALKSDLAMEYAMPIAITRRVAGISEIAGTAIKVATKVWLAMEIAIWHAIVKFATLTEETALFVRLVAIQNYSAMVIVILNAIMWHVIMMPMIVTVRLVALL